MKTNRLPLYIALGVIALLAIFRLLTSDEMVSPFSVEGLTLWIGALLSIFILSFLYDDNPFYKFAESLFIGVSAGYYAVQGLWEEIIKNLVTKLIPAVGASLVENFDPASISTEDRLLALIPLAMGIMLLWRLAPKGGWIARWPLALIVGWTAGTNLVRFLESDFLGQISQTLLPLVVMVPDAAGGEPTFSFIASFSNLVLVGGVLSALIYFFFSVEHRGVVGGVSKGGIWILMITFGAAFGFTVMGRIALLVGRMEFLFKDWLKLFG
jgi:hypothetical protein